MLTFPLPYGIGGEGNASTALYNFNGAPRHAGQRGIFVGDGKKVLVP